MVAGVILAAGESSRMGRDKALLPLGEETFLGHLIELLRQDLSPVVVILGHHWAEIRQRIAPDDNVVVLWNPDYLLGQLSSLQVALRYLTERPVEGAVVALVDHPAISRKAVQALLMRFEESRSPILIPTYAGRRGHPVLFARSLFPELLEAPVAEGARVVVRRHASDLQLVETDEEGILVDVDLPADYERFVGKTGKSE